MQIQCGMRAGKILLMAGKRVNDRRVYLVGKVLAVTMTLTRSDKSQSLAAYFCSSVSPAYLHNLRVARAFVARKPPTQDLTEWSAACAPCK